MKSTVAALKPVVAEIATPEAPLLRLASAVLSGISGNL